VAIYIKSNLVRSYFFLGLYFVLYITSFALSLSNQNQAFNHAVVLICTKYVYAGGQNCCTNHIKVPAAHQHLFTLMSIWNQWKMLHVLEHSQNNNKKRRKKKRWWPQDQTSKCRWKLFRGGLLPREGVLSTQNALHLHTVRPKRARVGVPTGKARVLDLDMG